MRYQYVFIVVLLVAGCGGERFTSHNLYRADTLSWRLAETGQYFDAQRVILPVLKARSYLTSRYDSSEYARLYSRLAFAAFRDSTRALEQSYDLSGRSYYHLLGDTLRVQTLRWAGQAALRGGDTTAAWSYFSESYHLARRLGIQAEAEKTWTCWQDVLPSVEIKTDFPLLPMGIVLALGLMLGLVWSSIIWRKNLSALYRWLSRSN